MELANRVAVITGGASGLGLATVERFVANGAKVAIFDLNQAAGSRIASRLGNGVAFHKVDVADEASVQNAIGNVVRQFGAIHVCCNFAGIGNAYRTVGKTGAFPLAEFSKVIQVNLVGTFNVLRLCAEKMAKNEAQTADGGRGVIINTASVAAYEGQIGQAAYSASKGGIVGMTLPIARDLASLGIRVNTIVPGLIETPLMLGAGEDAVKALGNMVLFPRRLGKPDEIARLAQFIVEDDYVNGECIRLDGGIRMQPK